MCGPAVSVTVGRSILVRITGGRVALNVPSHVLVVHLRASRHVRHDQVRHLVSGEAGRIERTLALENTPEPHIPRDHLVGDNGNATNLDAHECHEGSPKPTSDPLRPSTQANDMPQLFPPLGKGALLD